MAVKPRANVTPEKNYEVTGELAPDSTGAYADAGEHNGKRYYQLAGNGWFIAWDGDTTWLLSEVLGVVGARGWRRIDPDIEGNYDFYGTATGVATVTEI